MTVLLTSCLHRASVPTKLSLRPDTELGPVAVLTHSGPVPPRFGGPTTRGQGAANRALEYTATSLYVAAHDRSGVVLLLALLASPVTATVGAIIGATEGEPAAKSQPAREALARALSEGDPAGALQARVLALARERLGKVFVAPDDARTLLELRLSAVRLQRRTTGGNSLAPSADPLLVFRVTGHLRLVRVADGTELFARPLEHEDATRAFSAWAEDDAAHFRAALVEAVEALAVGIVEDTF